MVRLGSVLSRCLGDFGVVAIGGGTWTAACVGGCGGVQRLPTEVQVVHHCDRGFVVIRGIPGERGKCISDGAHHCTEFGGVSARVDTRLSIGGEGKDNSVGVFAGFGPHLLSPIRAIDVTEAVFEIEDPLNVLVAFLALNPVVQLLFLISGDQAVGVDDARSGLRVGGCGMGGRYRRRGDAFAEVRAGGGRCGQSRGDQRGGGEWPAR